MLERVPLLEKSLDDYFDVVEPGTIERIRKLAEPLQGARVLHVNATAYGGGVAELLATHVALMRDVGIEAEWQVIHGSDEFFAVTGVRVMLVHGIVVRRVDMMPLTKITDLTVDRSILGRMLGYGTVVLESAGQDQALSKVEYCPEPEAIYLEISSVAFGHGDD